MCCQFIASVGSLSLTRKYCSLCYGFRQNHYNSLHFLHKLPIREGSFKQSEAIQLVLIVQWLLLLRLYLHSRVHNKFIDCSMQEYSYWVSASASAVFECDRSEQFPGWLTDSNALLRSMRLSTWGMRLEKKHLWKNKRLPFALGTSCIISLQRCVGQTQEKGMS